MKTYGGTDLGTRRTCVQLHDQAPLPQGKSPPGTHWIGDWVDTRAGLAAVEKRKNLAMPGIESRPSSP
jgi:hypothetical protein